MEYDDNEAYRRRVRIERKRRRRRIRLIKRAFVDLAFLICVLLLVFTVVFVSKKLFVKEKPITIERHVELTNLDR
ncbi:MAG TPA: hypothetical protein DCX21_04430 [Eubacterium sp.]|nr:hypothetical protein [Eubacterium sp.]